MKKDIFTIVAAVGFCISMVSCGGEPAGDHTQPEATQGDYVRHNDIDSAGMAGDTAKREIRRDNTQMDHGHDDHEGHNH